MSTSTLKWITDPSLRVLAVQEKYFKTFYECLWNRPAAWKDIIYQKPISVPSPLDSYGVPIEPDMQLSVPNESHLQDICASCPSKDLVFSYMDPMRGIGPPYPPFHLLVREEYVDILNYLTNERENKSTELSGGIGTVVTGQPGIGQWLLLIFYTRLTI